MNNHTDTTLGDRRRFFGNGRGNLWRKLFPYLRYFLAKGKCTTRRGTTRELYRGRKCIHSNIRQRCATYDNTNSATQQSLQMHHGIYSL
jgi:hypothetical protein